MAKQSAHVSAWWHAIYDQFREYPSWAVESGIAFVLGLVFGFVSRNFGRMALIFCVSAFIALVLLDQARLITIHAPALRAFMKNPDGTIGSWFVGVMTFIHEHVFATIAAVIGFLLGWRWGQ